MIETWKTFIFQEKYTYRLQMLVILVSEMLFYGFCMQLIQNPHLPVYRLPVFLLLSIAWVWFRFMFVVTCWGFLGKLEKKYCFEHKKGVHRQFHVRNYGIKRHPTFLFGISDCDFVYFVFNTSDNSFCLATNKCSFHCHTFYYPSY